MMDALQKDDGFDVVLAGKGPVALARTNFTDNTMDAVTPPLTAPHLVVPCIERDSFSVCAL